MERFFDELARPSGRRCARLFAGVLTALALASCASTTTSYPDTGPPKGRPDEAVAHMAPTAGNAARGTVRFHAVPGGVHVTADLDGLSPGGTHAFHVHEWGDVSSADGTATGGHYNPEGHVHAGPDTPQRHAGDLGNLTADASGRAHYEITVDNLTIAGPLNPVLGRAVIVHKGVDDFQTQPTGNAGARIAQGVIGVAKPADAK